MPTSHRSLTVNLQKCYAVRYCIARCLAVAALLVMPIAVRSAPKPAPLGAMPSPKLSAPRERQLDLFRNSAPVTSTLVE